MNNHPVYEFKGGKLMRYVGSFGSMAYEDKTNYYTKDDVDDLNEITASALNDLQTNKLDATAYTPTDLSNYYTKSETSGSTQLTTKFNEKLDASAMTSSEKSGWNDAATKAPMYIYSAITSNINSFTSPIEGTAANINKQAHVLFHNVGSSEVTVTIPTTYKTPKNEAITLTIPVGGYAEVNCLVLASMIFVRAI
jgi:hypothetical protein